MPTPCQAGQITHTFKSLSEQTQFDFYVQGAVDTLQVLVDGSDQTDRFNWQTTANGEGWRIATSQAVPAGTQVAVTFRPRDYQDEVPPAETTPQPDPAPEPDPSPQPDPTPADPQPDPAPSSAG